MEVELTKEKVLHATSSNEAKSRITSLEKELSDLTGVKQEEKEKAASQIVRTNLDLISNIELGQGKKTHNF